MNNRDKIESVFFQFGAKGSEEYRKLTAALDVAENRRNKLEDDLESLKEIKSDLKRELNSTNDEIDRLQVIKDSMSKVNQEDRHERATRNLFVKNLHYATTEEDLEKYFERFGTILSVIVARQHETKVSRGFGFVEFAHSYMADRACIYKNHYIRGREVDVCFADRDYIDKQKPRKFKPY